MLIRYLKLIVIIVIISGLFASCASESISKSVKLPRINGYVNDYYNLLTNEEKENLKNILHGIFLKTGTGIAVLIVNSTYDTSIENYALKVINSMKTEKSTTAEILFVYAMDDRKLRLEVTGKSEDQLSNEICQQIVDIIIPFFKSRNYYQGIKEGIIQVQRILHQG